MAPPSDGVDGKLEEEMGYQTLDEVTASERPSQTGISTTVVVSLLARFKTKYRCQMANKSTSFNWYA